MADTPYALGMSALFNGTYDLAGGTMKLMLVNIAGGHYVPNFVTDQFLSAIASGDRISSTAALTGITVVAGSGPKSTFDAANTVFYACGPNELVEFAEHIVIHGMGVPKEQMKTEKWG